MQAWLGLIGFLLSLIICVRIFIYTQVPNLNTPSDDQFNQNFF